MFKSHTILTTPNAHIVIRSLEVNSLELINVHVRIFALRDMASVGNLCLHTSNSISSQFLNLINMKKYKLCSHLMNQTQVRLKY